MRNLHSEKSLFKCTTSTLDCIKLKKMYSTKKQVKFSKDIIVRKRKFQKMFIQTFFICIVSLNN